MPWGRLGPCGRAAARMLHVLAMGSHRTLSDRAQLHAAWAGFASVPAWWIGLRCLQELPTVGAVVLLTLCIPGTALLVGYLRAASGGLSAMQQSRLWARSALFNAVLAGGAGFTVAYAQPKPAAAAFLVAWFAVLALSAFVSVHSSRLAARAGS